MLVKGTTAQSSCQEKNMSCEPHRATQAESQASMMTSSMETFSSLLALYVGNSPVGGEFPAQRPVTRSFDVSIDLRLDLMVE